MALLLAAGTFTTAHAESYISMIRIVSMDTYDQNGYPMYYFKNCEQKGFRVDHADEWLVQVQGRKAEYTANVYLVALDGYRFSMDETLTNADLSLNAYLMEVNDDGRTAIVFVSGARNAPSDRNDPLANVGEVTQKTGSSLMVEPTIPAETPTPAPVTTPAPKYGFKQINGYWYYTNGVDYKKGFVNQGEYTFYFDDDYRMHYGWLYLGEDVYYFGTNPNGVMLKNTMAEIEGYTYFFDENGKMKTGWYQDVQGNTYFFATACMEQVRTTYDQYGGYDTELVMVPKGGMLKNYWFVAGENAYFLMEDGRLARDMQIANHVFDQNGITPSRTLNWDEYNFDDGEPKG
jgi:hypothetical protein